MRSIQPLDTACVTESVRRTHRLVTAHEAWVTAGLGAEIVAAVVETCPRAVDRVVRIGTAPVPTPSGKLRPFALPNAERIADAIRRLVAQS
jgi:pyruvate dehydrogenase E1 component beta subunit